ncbi:JAB N-terminal domain-containing protein [Dactylosporangium sp. NPDC050588]|uniref:JAB N-terminal domain-containing protein n=1 Tax=Dactylosporangium sp. NPDC050588 TaxID=3157211 RepID=UPI003409A5C7
MADADHTDVRLFRMPEVSLAGSVPLAPLLRARFEPDLGMELDGARFVLTFHQIATQIDVLDGVPVLINLYPWRSHVTVRIEVAGRLVLQHPFAVRDAIAGPLQRELARQDPAVTHWGYEIVALGDVPRPAARSRRRNRIEELPDPPLPVAALADFGVDDPPGLAATAVTVVLAAPVAAALDALGGPVELGGLLFGQVYADAAGPDRQIVHVGELAAVRGGAATATSFTFPAGAFLGIDHADRGRRLVGWYHTHVADEGDLRLSPADVVLHTGSFRRPWQVALLAGPVRDGRAVRAYSLTGGRLTRVPVHTAAGKPA